MLVVEEEVPPRAVDGPAVDRAGERAEAFRRLKLPVDVELVGEKPERSGVTSLPPFKRRNSESCTPIRSPMQSSILNR